MPEDALSDETPGDAEEADDVVEGVVVPFPGAVAPPVKHQRGTPGEWKPIVPEHLRTRQGVLKAASWHYRRARHHGLYHGVRVPQRIVVTAGWAIVGAALVVRIQLNWWWCGEQTYLRHQAAADGDAGKWLTLHKHTREVRLVRGFILLGEVIAVSVGSLVVNSYSELWWIPFWIAAVPVLAWIGRPDDKPILTSSTVPVAIERLSIEVIIRALGVLGIGEMNRALREDPAKAIATIDGPMRDGPGWLWRGDLPPGVTAGHVAEKREELASGLRRPLGCVWPEGDPKQHPGRLNLFVGDEDMTTAEQPPWPLAKRGKVNLFKPQQFGYDPRGRPVTVLLMFASVLIGSVPRMGKTFLLRLLMLICALDPRCELHLFDLKGTGDLAPLRPVAHAYRAGDELEDIEYLIADYRALQKEMRRRTKIIRDIAEREPHRCPENKITDELANDPQLGLHPIAIAMDETQVAFQHPAYGPELEGIATDLTKRGPALGIVQMLATQRPDKESIPTQISANVVLRYALKLMGQLETDMVMGTSSYKSGVRPTAFGFDEKGVCYYGGDGLRPKIMRTQFIDGPAAKVVAARARVMREREGRITGYALGENPAGETRSFAADVLSVFSADKNLWCDTIAQRLRAQLPEAYESITPDAVGSQLRALEIEVKSVRETGKGVRSGTTRAAVAEAAGEG
jgi:DNA segregation ATPase FtsK/SpoIIIE, S-DNA-T family